MTNTEAWDAIAARYVAEVALPLDVAHYGPDVPTERELRLLGDVAGKRVLELGCGAGQASIAFARQGAHAIAVDASGAMLDQGRRLAREVEVAVEWHRADLADLAFLRGDSLDLAFSAHAIGEFEDLDRLFRQVHRVLRPHSPLVFSYEHPMALCIGREGDEVPGGLPLGALEVRRSYFDRSPVTVRRFDREFTLYPRGVGVVFGALRRAGFTVELVLEPEPVTSGGPGPTVPPTIVWRARKEGV